MGACVLHDLTPFYLMEWDSSPQCLWQALVLFFCFLFFWLRWLFVAAHGLSLVAASGGYSSTAVRRLLIAVASLVAEHGL